MKIQCVDYRIASGLASFSKTRGKSIHGRSMPASMQAKVFENEVRPDAKFWVLLKVIHD